MEEKTIIHSSVTGSVRPGTRLNGIYEIEQLIAQGGMGEVYRGFNIQTHDPVAIKMIRPEFSNNTEIMELFRREASTLHNLIHEAIVRYFVFSVDPDVRRAYLAMEFVEGPSLAKRLGSGRLPLAEVRVLQRRIAYALDAAHRQGVIHRDVSPDNIILPDGDVRNAKIIDFGIARSLHKGEQTIIGDGFAGKYNYVSPEQLGMAGGDVTFKSDIYSFGLVLAELVRGRALDMKGTEAEIIEKRRAVPDVSDVDRAIRPLIQAMLQPLPDKRPLSMAAVAEWGESSRAAAARRERSSDEAPKRSVAHLATILGALVAILSVGGVAYVVRDDIALWFRTPGASTQEGRSEPGTHLPILVGPKSAPGLVEGQSTQPAANAPESLPQTMTPAEGQTPDSRPPTHVPTSDELADDIAPRASQSLVELPPATVGASYRHVLPGFTDPGGKGLRLAAASLPEGLTFEDLSNGKGVIQGAPTQAGNATMQVIATNHAGRTAQMTATIVVADKASPLPIAHSPDSGKSESDQAVAPVPVPPPVHEAILEKPHTSQSPEDRERLFVQSYNGGECFFVKPVPGDRGGPAYLGVGDQPGQFKAFVDAFKQEVGAEPQLILRQITAPECEVLDLIRAGAGEASGAPRIELTDYAVGPDRPLAGKIANLGKRNVSLILIDNDGAAYRLDAQPEPGGDAATFSVPLTPDAESARQSQVILAIASTKPIPALETFRRGPLKAIAPALLGATQSGSALVGAEFFTFAN